MAQFNFAEKSEIEELHIEPTDVMTGDKNKSRYLLYQLKLSMARAKQIDIIVSFLMESGVRMLLSDLKAALQRGVRIRILTGNYLGITQPSALYLLKKELGDKVELHFYSDKGRSFHPKSYIFHYVNMNEIYIGSSNISRSALTSGIEWNYRFNNNQDSQNFNLFYETFEDLENAFKAHVDYYMDKMILACEQVEKAHMDLLPTPFLSAVINDCMDKGMDVTRGGAHYNLSGIQMIQVANLADSLAAVKQLVFDEKKVSKERLLKALETNFEEDEILRTMLLNKVPKYGNDVEWVDELGAKWAGYFRERLKNYKNYRGGLYHTGMYTVSAHVPMGENVGASPDGRYAGTPLADGGMSPVYGRDTNGPTAVLKSVSRLDKSWTTNGGLLNMKFLPEFFKTENGIDKFAKMLRTFVDLEIPHIQFNVVRKEDLQAAQKNPEAYRGLTVRVAGYTAYFVELADELQNEIIARTSYNDI